MRRESTATGMNQIVEGENLTLLRAMEAGSVELIYVDPPFNTGRRQQRMRMRTVRDEMGDRTGFGGRRYRTERLGLEEAGAGGEGYADDYDDFVGFLRPRMEEARRVLTETGSLFVHLDAREVHYAKVMLDEVFGRECFQNEIIWAYDYGARARGRWPAKHDNLLWYTRDPERYNLQSRGLRPDRVHGAEAGGSGEGGTRQDTDRCVVAHNREPDGQGEDGIPDTKAGRSSGADCEGALESW